MTDSPVPAAESPSLWRSAWWKPTGVIALGIACAVVLLAFVILLARPLALLFIAVCIAAALAPVAARLARRIPRNTAILLVYLAVLVVIGALLALFVRPIVVQIATLEQNLPELVERGRAFLDENGLSEIQPDAILGGLNQIGQSVLGAPFAALSTLFDLILVLIVSLYLLLDAPNIERFLLSLFGGRSRERVERVGAEILQVCGSYIGGVLINMVLVGVVTSVGLTVIGVPFALILGVLAGLLEVLPTIGSLIAAVIVVVVALLQSPGTALVTLVFVLIVQQLQGNVITPYVMREQVKVPQFIVPLAVVAGGGIGGLLGAIVAVPLVAVARVLVLRVVAPFIRRQTGADDERIYTGDAAPTA